MDALFESNMGLCYAYDLFTDSTAANSRVTVEPRILAGQTDEEIAYKMGTLPGTVFWYEGLFFAVRDRLRTPAYIIDVVLRTALEEGAGSCNFTSKLFGYLGGPTALDHVRYGFIVGDRPTDPSQLNAFYDRQFRAGIRQKAVAAIPDMEINRFNVMQLMELHGKLIDMERHGPGSGDATMRCRRSMACWARSSGS